MAEQDEIRRQERIEAYVGGKLSAKEFHAFEAEMAADEQLRQDVEVERALTGTIQHSSELRFRDVVLRVSEEQERGTAGGRGAEKPVIPIDRGRMKWWAVAASVALLIGTAAVLLFQGPNAEELALAEVQDFTLSVRSDSTTTDANAALLMQGRQLILDNKPAAAITLLRTVTMPVVCEEATRTWLLGSAYVLTGDATKARVELQQASQAGCAMSPKAAALLKAL